MCQEEGDRGVTKPTAANKSRSISKYVIPLVVIDSWIVVIITFQFPAGFAHKDNPQSIDLNCLRLCFQVFLEGNERGAFTFALKPVVSDPIFDKKAKNDLTICKMTECAAPVTGGKEILLFCEKVSKDDIEVRFFQEKDGQVVWEGFGDFQP